MLRPRIKAMRAERYKKKGREIQHTESGIGMIAAVAEVLREDMPSGGSSS